MNLTTRNLTDKFKDIRTIAQSRRLETDGSKARSSIVVSTTEYLDQFQTIDDIQNKINQEINNARKIYNDLIVDIFSKTNSKELLETKISVINTYFDDIRKRFEDIKKLIRSYPDPHRTIVSNMFQQKTDKFKKIIQKFQQLKADYVGHLKSQIKIEKKTISFFETPVIDEDFESSCRDRGGETMQQYDQTSYDLELLDQRNKEIAELCGSITELSRIFQDLSLMVMEQGEKIDEIDKTLDKTVDSTKRGVEELKKAEKHQKSCCIM